MDINVHSSQPQSNASVQPLATSAGNRKSSKKVTPSWKLWGGGLLGLIVVALVVAVLLLIGFGGPKPEGSYVYTNKLQAVFLNTGQVYFGNLKEVNSKYFVLDNIYYLQTSSSSTATTTSSANTSVSLVKLGCELHAPYDQMVINRDEVTFWENLESDGQVATAVATFQKDNPNGQKCTDQSSSAGTGSSTSVQGAATTGTSSSTSTVK